MKAYRFFAEPGYLHGIKVSYTTDYVAITAKCFRSMKKTESPHNISANIELKEKSLSGKCSCVAGIDGYCHHIIALFFYLAHCKQLGLRSLPDDLTFTSMKQRWSVPRGKKIQQKQIQDILVKKPQMSANYSKLIKSTLYSPSKYYGLLHSASFEKLFPLPIIASILPHQDNLANLETVATKFGSALKGSVLSYQQKLLQDYIINDFTLAGFPLLPYEDSGDRLENAFIICLTSDKQAALESLNLDRDVAIDIESKTVQQSSSQLWYLLRKKRITASKFGLVARRVGNFERLVAQLNPLRHVTTAPMRREIELEPKAASIYVSEAKENKVNLFSSGLIINPKCPWLGCSPDRKVFDIAASENGLDPFGLLEVKVVKEGDTSFDNVRYLSKNTLNEYSLKITHEYFYQVQCQLGLTGLQL